jgi:tripartite-type tricarboxylate transporter receptor subunit TctC
VVSNMQGASSMKAASYLYGIAPKDGTVIGTFNKSMPLYQALGQHEFEFKTEQMAWIGSASQSVEVVSVWSASGVKSIDDAKKREVVMGADSATGTMAGFPALLNATLGTRFKIVTGYPGSTAVNIAMERGEVDGRGSSPWITLKVTRPEWVKNGLIVPLVQIGLKKEADLPNTPLLIDLAENDADKRIFHLVSAPISIERPFAGPAGMAPEALAILRRAFDQMMKDPEFLAEATKQGMDIDPRTGEEVAAIVADIVNTPADTVRRFKDVTSFRIGETGGEGRPTEGQRQ